MEKSKSKQTLFSREAVLSSDAIIFDMDGTLYQLDGENGEMSGSSLETAILQNSKEFIISREGCGEEMARLLLDQGLADEIGISNFLAKRYEITRADYFNVAWNIDPGGIVNNFEMPVRVVKKLSSRGKKLILVTAAPKVWQSLVIDFIGLTGYFEKIFTGENYGRKEEVFRSLSREYGASNLCSIGDQLATDILPAQKVGINTLLINSSNDLAIIFERS